MRSCISRRVSTHTTLVQLLHTTLIMLTLTNYINTQNLQGCTNIIIHSILDELNMVQSILFSMLF